MQTISAGKPLLLSGALMPTLLSYWQPCLIEVCASTIPIHAKAVQDEERFCLKQKFLFRASTQHQKSERANDAKVC